MTSNLRGALQLALISLAGWSWAAEPVTGPETEKRFPPLVVPEQFRATLFACDPLVEYPSVIALGPRQGTLFVAHDYMTGLGTEIIRRDEIRLIADTDGDGYADSSKVFASGFHSIQGLAYHNGTVFVMHAPLLTSLRDTDGDGIADDRRDLLDGLGLPPEKNPVRLHCANGVAAGHDGWLYLAMGDNGTDVVRPEGDRLVLEGGGILRCREDGRDLHIFSTGLRNIYDVALDEELNVFVRDNENDGGDYMIRVIHSFQNADHGYPYLYHEHPDEALAPLADLGRGSSAGGACYLETAFPTEYRGNLFFCEWGKSVVRYERTPTAGGFAPPKEIEFASASAKDPYGFKPTDVIVDRDGSLLVSDWCDGQRPKRGRGRIYRISYQGREGATVQLEPHAAHDPDSWMARLDSPSYLARLEAQLALEKAETGPRLVSRRLAEGKLGVLARMHAVAIMARAEREAGLPVLFALAERDEDARVRVQAIRAIADQQDPVLVLHRLDARQADSNVATRIAMLAHDSDARVQLAAVVAMARLGWREAPTWIRDQVRDSEGPLAHAAMQTLRRCDNWPAVLALLDEPDSSPARRIALRAIAGQAQAEVVDGLIARLDADARDHARREYAEALARVHRVRGKWVYWGYRPGPRAANTQTWDRTETIAARLDKVLADPDLDVRAAALRAMQREGVPVRPESLASWVRIDREPGHVAAILASLPGPSDETRKVLADIIRDPTHDEQNRRRALSQLIKEPGDAGEQLLLPLARALEEGPVLAEMLNELGKRPSVDSREFLLDKLQSSRPEVRAQSITALASLGTQGAASFIPGLLKDGDIRVRRAAATAAVALQALAAIPLLLDLAGDTDAATCAASLRSLRELREPRALPAAVAALEHPVSQLAAIDYLRDFGTPQHLTPLQVSSSQSRSVDVLSRAVQAVDHWQQPLPTDSPQFIALEHGVAQLQGDTGLVLRWRARSTHSPENAKQVIEQLANVGGDGREDARWFASGSDSQIALPPDKHDGGAAHVAYSEFYLATPARLQFFGSSSLRWQIHVAGELRYEPKKEKAAPFDADPFEVDVAAGTTRIVVELPAAPQPSHFHLRFRRISDRAEHERLARFVLQNNGNVDRGRELFRDAEKTLCAKCHRLDGLGGNVGPDLAGIGRRFSRIHLIESVLEPSRTIAPSYETIVLGLTDGRVVTGVRVEETADAVILGDDQGKTLTILKAEIEQRSAQPRSTMPEGLEKRLSDREFLDLISYLSGATRDP